MVLVFSPSPPASQDVRQNPHGFVGGIRGLHRPTQRTEGVCVKPTRAEQKCDSAWRAYHVREIRRSHGEYVCVCVSVCAYMLTCVFVSLCAKQPLRCSCWFVGITGHHGDVVVCVHHLPPSHMRDGPYVHVCRHRLRHRYLDPACMRVCICVYVCVCVCHHRLRHRYLDPACVLCVCVCVSPQVTLSLLRPRMYVCVCMCVSVCVYVCHHRFVIAT